MKLTREQQDQTETRWAGWHILTVAEAGFSMLDIYGRLQHGLSVEIIREFADRCNQRDEAGSLYPRAPISAIPMRFFREQENSRNPAVVNDLKQLILDFLIENQKTIHAQRILIDFHVSPAAVPLRYVDAAEDVVRSNSDNLIKDVVIFT